VLERLRDIADIGREDEHHEDEKEEKPAKDDTPSKKVTKH